MALQGLPLCNRRLQYAFRRRVLTAVFVLARVTIAFGLEVTGERGSEGDEYVLSESTGNDEAPLMVSRVGSEAQYPLLPAGIRILTLDRQKDVALYELALNGGRERVLGVSKLGSSHISLHLVDRAGWNKNAAWIEARLAAEGDGMFVLGGMADAPHSVWRYSFSDRQFEKVIELKMGNAYGCMSCSPDGKSLALIWGEDRMVDGSFWCTAVLVELARGTAVYLPLSMQLDQGFHGGSPVWSPKGSWLMVGGDRFEGKQYKGRLTLVNPKTQALHALTDLRDFGGWMDDGTFLARFKEHKRWSVVDINGKVVRELSQNGQPFHEPGSKYLLGVKGTVAEPKNELWDLEGKTLGPLPNRCTAPRPCITSTQRAPEAPK